MDSLSGKNDSAFGMPSDFTIAVRQGIPDLVSEELPLPKSRKPGGRQAEEWWLKEEISSLAAKPDRKVRWPLSVDRRQGLFLFSAVRVLSGKPDTDFALVCRCAIGHGVFWVADELAAAIAAAPPSKKSLLKQADSPVFRDNHVIEERDVK